MKRSWILMALAALAIAAAKPEPKTETSMADKPKETWCIGPISAMDAQAGVFTVVVKSQGQSMQTQTEGPRFLGSFIVASSSATSEDQRSFQCAPHCRFVAAGKPSGATLSDFQIGDMVHVTCASTNAPWTAIQVTHHVPRTPAPRR
ncbi:MAG: hypothetical protein FJ395_18620 [Verrucomicrobia bacterium]|nr:hypothetical protein [Verrucomicrobiota bacterium]